MCVLTIEKKNSFSTKNLPRTYQDGSGVGLVVDKERGGI